MVTVIRLGSLLLGLTCAGLGSYGAFEFAYKLEGNMSYLVIAAPVVAVTAALIPPIAEATWRAGGYVKALLWWAVMVPAGAVVLSAAAERVHDAKAGAEAERRALRGAASRAEATLARTEAELVKVTAEANSARGQKQCGPACRTKLAAEATAKADVDAARLALLQVERKTTTEGPLKAPPHGCCQRHSTRWHSWRSGRASPAGRPGFLAASPQRGGDARRSASHAYHRRRRGGAWQMTTTSSHSTASNDNLRARLSGRALCILRASQ